MSLFFTEPVTVVTGKQGAGKTLWSIWQADESVKAGTAKHIYQYNIRDADPRVMQPLPFEPNAVVSGPDGAPVPAWTTLPEGSIVLVDEAHRVFPQRGPGRAPPHIEAMSETRYQGIRWVLITQAPASLDAFLRDRTNRHFHIERKGGLSGAQCYEFDRCVDADRDWRARKDAQRHPFKYPKKYFGAYTSAKSHFFRVRIPWKLWLVPVFIAIAAYVGWQVVDKVGALGASALQKMEGTMPSAAAAEVGGEHSASPRARRSSGGELSSVQYLEQFQPVVASMPWTAPAYRDREILAEPQVLCVLSGMDGRDGCRCYTEQVTPYEVDKATCITIARHGIYNPYRRPFGSPGQDRQAPEEPRKGASGAVGPDPYASEDGSPPVRGVRTPPEVVGSPRQGEVWGRAPEVKRASVSW